MFLQCFKSYFLDEVDRRRDVPVWKQEAEHPEFDSGLDRARQITLKAAGKLYRS